MKVLFLSAIGLGFNLAGLVDAQDKAPTGILIAKDSGCLSMGVDADISLCRTDDEELTVSGALVVEGDSTLGDVTLDTATFSTSSGGTNSLADLDDSVAAAEVSVIGT